MSFSPPPAANSLANPAPTLRVDANVGVDQPSGRPHLPYKTIAAALTAAQGNALIQLAPGTYSAATGERFPLVLPAGVAVVGQEATQGQGVVIAGGGAGPGGTSVAVGLGDRSQLRGVTVQNPDGTAVLVEAGSPLVRACRLGPCRVGVQVRGTAQPDIVDSRLEGGAAGQRGISFGDRSRGEVHNCTVSGFATGIYAEGTAAPLVRRTQCSGNRVGLAVAAEASPVLRDNRLVQNDTLGMTVQDSGRPDLGQPDDPAGNILRYNRQGDLRNDSRQRLVAVGNDLLPQGLSGAVTLAPSQRPDPVAVPPSLLQGPRSSTQPEAATPAPAVSPPPAPPGPTAPPVASRFPDLGGHWAARYIEALADRGLVKGYSDGTYRPQEPINRAQFAALVAAAYPTVPAVRQSIVFRDVPVTHWAYRAIDQAQRRGFLGGYPDQTFRPEQGMVRVQAIVAVANGLALAKAPASVLGVYRDRAQIPSYAIDALAAATQAGLVINHPVPDLLRPLETMTRAEIAVLIYQSLVVQGTAPRLGTEPQAMPPPASARGSFPDIYTHWALDFIQGLHSLGLVQGDDAGRFNPAQPMTRAQFAALVSRAFAPAPRRPAQVFRDVPASHWGAGAIQSAYRGGFLSGFPDRTFGPENPLLRAQVWVALVAGLGLLPQQPGDRALLTRYRDRAAIPDYALEAIAKATQLNLVVNVPDLAQLNPNRVASRADVCAAVYQALVLQRRLPRLDNPFIVRP